MLREQVLPDVAEMERTNEWQAYEEVEASDYYPDGNDGYNFGVHFGTYTVDRESIDIGVEWFQTELEQQKMMFELAYDGFVHTDLVYARENILDILHRTTDDATAYPVFLVLRERGVISMNAYEYVYFDDDQISEFSVSFMAESIDLNDWYDKDDGFEDNEELADYFAEYGYGYNVDDEGTQLVYWSKDDEIKTTEVERVFWTREEANKYCDAFAYNGPFHSYSVCADGVLKKLMDLTCERQIERLSAKKEGRSSNL